MMKSVLLLAVLAVAANAGWVSDRLAHANARMAARNAMLMKHPLSARLVSNTPRSLMEAECDTCSEFTELLTEIEKLSSGESLDTSEVPEQFKSSIGDLQSCLASAVAPAMDVFKTAKDFFCDTKCTKFNDNLEKMGDENFSEDNIKEVCSADGQTCLNTLTQTIVPLFYSYENQAGALEEELEKCLVDFFKDLGVEVPADEENDESKDKEEEEDTTDEGDDDIGEIVNVVRAFCTTPPGKPTTYCGLVVAKLEDSADCDALGTEQAQIDCNCRKASNAGCCLRTYYDWAATGTKDAGVNADAAEVKADVLNYCKVDISTTPKCAGASKEVTAVTYAKSKLALSNVACGKSTDELAYAVVKLVTAKTGLNVAEVSASVVTGTCACCSDVASTSARRLLATVNPSFDVTMQAKDDATLSKASTSLNSAVSGNSLDLSSQSSVLGSEAGVDATNSVAAEKKTDSSELVPGSAAAQSVLTVGLFVVVAMLF